MAIANLLIKIGADISELQVNTAKAVSGIEKASSKIDSIAGSIGKTLIGAFSVTAIAAWIDQTVQAGSRIDDLSKKLKVSTDAIQKWDYAMSLAGGTIDDVDTALTFMNKTLGGGGTGVKQALTEIGLSFDDIRKMSPEDAFNAIVAALTAMDDPFTQASARVAIFGKGAGALASAMDEGFAKTAAGATVMSKETIARLDAAGDAWTKLGHIATIVSGELLAAAFAAFDQPPNEQKYADKFFKPLHLDTQKAIDDLKELAKWFSVIAGGPGEFPKAPKAPTLGGAGVPDITISDADARKAEENLNRIRTQMDANAKAAAAMADKVNDLARSFRGLDTIDSANVALSAVNKNLKAGFTVAQMTTDQQRDLNKMMADAIAVFTRYGQTAPQAMKDLYVQTIQIPPVFEGIQTSLGKIGTEFDVVIPKMIDASTLLTYTAGIPFGKKIGEEIDLVPPKLAVVHDNLGALAQSLSNLANVAGGTFGGIAQGLATIVGAADSANKGLQSMKDGIGDWKAGNSFQGILGMASGIGGIISAAISATQVLINLFDRSKGRDLVVDFANTMGGFDELHKRLLELGDQGEQLWIKLTQGVGKNNPAQAKAVIDEVTAALNKQSNAQDKVQVNTEEQAQATIETATQAVIALQDVTDKLGANVDAWADWSRHVTGYLDDVAKSIRALPTPTAPGSGGDGSTPGFATGTRGQFLNFGAGSYVKLHGYERVVTEAESLGVSDGDIVIQLQAGELWDQRVVRVARRDAARGGMRTRASTGRSY